MKFNFELKIYNRDQHNRNLKRYKNHIQVASITVEATFVFPIFFFALLIFIYFFQIILIQTEIQKALIQTASFSSQYSYFVEEFLKKEKDIEETQKESLGYQGKISDFAEGVLDKALVKIKFNSFVNKEFLEESCLKNGVLGISLLQSEFMENGKDIDIVAAYKIEFPSPFFKLPSYTIIQKVKTKAYLGKSMVFLGTSAEKGTEEAEKEIVYIAQTGKVYHISKECTYLNPSIKEVNFSDLDYVRNSGGSKYSFCESCCKENEIYHLVYITTWGTGYHSRLDCPGLKRTIREETLKEAKEQGYYACSKCG